MTVAAAVASATIGTTILLDQRIDNLRKNGQQRPV
jgi:hypothetical protein